MGALFGIYSRDAAGLVSQELISIGNQENYLSGSEQFRIVNDRFGTLGVAINTPASCSQGTMCGAIEELGVVVFDGRIDNHDELCEAIGACRKSITAVTLIGLSFRKWKEAAFSKLKGDWAIALWVNEANKLYLARDHAGSRSLYYRISPKGHVYWGTYIEWLLGRDAGSIHLSKRFAASFIGGIPLKDITPYEDIKAVLPGHYVVIQSGQVKSFPHWRWMRRERITYKSDAAYEEECVALMQQAVMRRITPSSSIVAHLSGGMDSTSIVCVADHLYGKGEDRYLVDTLSYYDDDDPSWDDKEYVLQVEAIRGRLGIHIKDSLKDFNFRDLSLDGALPAPAKDRLLEESEYGKKYSVIISGIGGDELLGGVPSALPELADYFAAGRLFDFMPRAYRWSLSQRVPIWSLMGKAVRMWWQLSREHSPSVIKHEITEQMPPWLAPASRGVFAAAVREATVYGDTRGLLPSQVANGITWWRILETLPHLYQGSSIRYEYRYPYLDRDIVEFLLSVPRDQLIRPGQRRSLMRRAMKGYVPDVVLNRKRKANRLRGPMFALQGSRSYLDVLFRESVLVELGLIDPHAFALALDKTNRGDSRWWGKVMKTCLLELWLQGQPGVSPLRKQLPGKSSYSLVG